ncbi:MAG TPA: hypothetical protein VGL58_11370 [Caulobacteraceae bacterium]|jgi:hypothetical protein
MASLSTMARGAVALASFVALAASSFAGQSDTPHWTKIVPLSDRDTAAFSDQRQACIVGWQQCAETCNMSADPGADCRKTCDASYFSCAGAEDLRRAEPTR